MKKKSGSGPGRARWRESLRDGGVAHANRTASEASTAKGVERGKREDGRVWDGEGKEGTRELKVKRAPAPVLRPVFHHFTLMLSTLCVNICSNTARGLIAMLTKYKY